MSQTFKQRLSRHIAMNGPMPLAEFMHWAMADPKQGYYATRQPIGKDGDFITAPEISQMFGELLGVWAIQTWKNLGEPSNFALVEIGPGRGTLMKDLLRAANSNPQFCKAARIVLVETSETLQAQQLEALQKVTTENTAEVEWVKSIKELPEIPSIIIANELLDVLPVRQYVKSNNKWHERAVGLNDDDALSWVLTDAAIEQATLPEGHENEPEGAVFEISSIREAFVENAANHIQNHDGVALFIDYGHTKSDFGDTFQAMKNHKYVDALDEPANADLTSHVDFAALSETAKAKGMHVYSVINQGRFLLDMGLLERAGQLGAEKNEEVRSQLTQQAERLALPDEMGDLFKCLAFSKDQLRLPPFTET